MGQVFRRAIGRVPTSAKTRPSPSQSVSRNPGSLSKLPKDEAIGVQDLPTVSSPDDTSKMTAENTILEERNPEYDAMLQKMVGTIRTKPGGKLEMGEAIIVQKSKRPLPVRGSNVESERLVEKPILPGTLTIAQVQEIILLHQGKSAEHNGQMVVHDIAQKFRVDTAEVEKILQFISLTSEQHDKGRRQ